MRLSLALALLVLSSVSALTVEAQNVAQTPTFRTVSAVPDSVQLTAGGNIEVDLPACTYGFVADAPDVNFNYTPSGASSLYIHVESNDDTTLLINKPDGSWVCDDDSYGRSRPFVEVSPAGGGLYNIWVGTYGDALAEDVWLFIATSPPAGAPGG